MKIEPRGTASDTNCWELPQATPPKLLIAVLTPHIDALSRSPERRRPPTPRRNQGAWGARIGRKIHLPAWARNQLALLHLLTPAEHSVHGPESGSNYLELVERFMGQPDADNLNFAFDPLSHRA